LASAAARALPHETPRRNRYAALLARRFPALEAAARGEAADARALGLARPDRDLARRALGPLEARWHDGDENLVRGLLDRWMPPGGAATGSVIARRLLDAAAELARIDARPETWWFFLWEMESLLARVAGEGRC
jgi:hypothetical protein